MNETGIQFYDESSGATPATTDLLTDDDVTDFLFENFSSPHQQQPLSTPTTGVSSEPVFKPLTVQTKRRLTPLLLSCKSVGCGHFAAAAVHHAFYFQQKLNTKGQCPCKIVIVWKLKCAFLL